MIFVESTFVVALRIFLEILYVSGIQIR